MNLHRKQQTNQPGLGAGPSENEISSWTHTLSSSDKYNRGLRQIYYLKTTNISSSYDMCNINLRQILNPFRTNTIFS